jgi:uncharacterized protein with von Willebrand factor type A (vWA) domain
VPADTVPARFASVLRDEGVVVPVSATVSFARALAVVDAGRASQVYWAGRATLVPGPELVPAYDRAFSRFWTGAARAAAAPSDAPDRFLRAEVPQEEQSARQNGEEAGEEVGFRASAAEVLRSKDFARCTDDELDEVYRFIGALRLNSRLRRSRRQRPSSRRRGTLDVRTTMRRSLATSGEAIDLARRQRTLTQRPIVLLLDISGSMDAYGRPLLRFAQAAVASGVRVEAFTLGTRVTRVTKDLNGRDVDAALERAARAVDDWSGGTRLGEGLRTFNDRWGTRGVARGASVIIVSDGWERGDPALLEEQMQRLARVAHRIVWVNPLKASPGYEPLARGMAAALPHVDAFVEGHSFESLEQLAEAITT